MSLKFTQRFTNAGIVAATLVTAACSNGGQVSSPAIPASNSISTNGIATNGASTSSISTGSTRSAMSVTQSSSTSTQTAYETTILGDGPSAFFPLNDSGSTALSLVNGLTGTYGAGVAQTGSALTQGGIRSASFTSSQYSAADVVSVAPGADLAPANTISIEFWIEMKQPNTSTQAQPVISYGSKTAGVAYEIQLLPRNTFGFQIHGGAPYYYWGYEEWMKTVPSKPYHVVATFDGSMERMYVDGVQTLSVKANGPLNYGTIASSATGLTIGNDVGFGRMGVNAMISNVAIYPTVLSQAQVSRHYSAGTSAVASATPTSTPAPSTPSSTPAPAPTAIPNAVSEAPKSVFAFEDSIGLDSHFNYYSYPDYLERFQDAALVQQLPAHHLRDGGTGEQQIMSNFCASGVKHSIGFPIQTTAAVITQQINSWTPQCVDYVEPANEEDTVNDPNWVADLMAEQKLLYTTVKSNPAFSNIVVLGPGLANASKYALLSGIASISDAASIHDGECDGSPLTTHYTNAATSFKALQAIYSPTKPIYTTEFAVANNPQLSGCGVSPAVAAKYVSRQFLVRFNLGMPRNYMNEMSQEPSLGGWGVLGLINANATPMPAYTELHSLLGALPAGQSSSAGLSNLSYALTGSTTNVDHTLLQSNNGTYYMVMWVEVDGWSHNTQSAISIPAQNVSLALPASVKTVTVSTPSTSSYTMSTSSVTPSGGAVPLSVTDSPMVVSFHL